MKIISLQNNHLKKLLAGSIILLFYMLPVSSGSISSQGYDDNIQNIPLNFKDQELYLLRVEHYLYVKASEDVGIFHIRFSFPPDYGYQVPLLLEIHNDSSLSVIKHYNIENDTFHPNKIINFTINPIKKYDSVLLHFSCWVLVINHDFGDLPPYVKFPKKSHLPEDTTIWLVSTKVVQLNSILIRHKACQLRGISSNLIRYADRIAPFIKNHRYSFFVFGLYTGLLLSQDARTTLLINGENVGRGHLACAFLRLYNVPARVLLVNNDQGFWTQMHYMVEYFCPGYGWVLLETTQGKTPYATYHQVINRICYPEDEEDTKRDYIFPFMKGEERWLWIDTDDVVPYYVDCDSGSKSQMFTETNISVDTMIASYSFVLTQMVFRNYQKCVGVNLTGENLAHFENAKAYQKQGILALQHSSDINGYLMFLNMAYNEYQEIEN
ncbi:hypothetical protein AYK25_05875 [Thermoplasmatales archaeon SM1-50]|nr:MAG: hypothetical protein AYK25_05875 [Thermoplasmatales archaeon SM1-50]